MEFHGTLKNSNFHGTDCSHGVIGYARDKNGIQGLYEHFLTQSVKLYEIHVGTWVDQEGGCRASEFRCSQLNYW